MKSVLTFFVTLSVSWSALGDADLHKPINWEVAKTTSDFMPDTVARAGENVEFLDNGSACTGQFISKKGIYLTAMHCVMTSIMNVGPRLSYNVGEADPHYKGWFVQDFLKLPYQTHDIKDARWIHAQGESQPPLVLALGRGYFELPPNIETMEEYNTIRAKASDFSIFQEDFAILKFDLQKPDSHHCIQMNAQDPVAGDDAWAVGFPGNFVGTRKPAQKFVLKAKIFRAIADLKSSRGDQFLYPEEAWFDSNRFFLLAGQVIAGMSGGAVFNKDGQIIGTIVAQTASNDTVVLKSSFVSTELRKKFSSVEFIENFTCGNKGAP